MIKDANYKDQRAITIENDKLRAVFLPETGANLASLFDISSGREFMVQRPGEFYLRQPFGGKYVDAECAGLDDMLPTIDECYYQGYPWDGTLLADHGEIWSLESRVERTANSVSFNFNGIRLPYIFKKTVSITENNLTISYLLENPTAFKMDFLWAAHTMVNAEPGLKLYVPESCRKAVLTFSESENPIGKYGDEIDYPVHHYDGITKHLDIMGRPGEDFYKYYFRDKLNSGWCAVRYPDETIFGLSFPIETVPYLGILPNSGCFQNIYNIFLEPCTAPFDRPDVANLHGTGSYIPAYGKLSWFMNITIDKGGPVKEINRDGKIIYK